MIKKNMFEMFALFDFHLIIKTILRNLDEG